MEVLNASGDEPSTYTSIGSSPLVISGLLKSGVVFPNVFLKLEIITSGTCGLVSCSLSNCSRTTFNISPA
jgi:hypothetical protein